VYKYATYDAMKRRQQGRMRGAAELDSLGAVANA
jgi:hypothetical protein